MSNPNPYSAPNADLTVPYEKGEFELHAPRTVNASQGVQWLVDGFNYFKQGAGIWIAITIIGILLMVGLSILPVINFVVSLTTYLWVGGLMLGCKALHDREPLKISHLFAGFSEELGPLLLLGVVLMAATFVLVIVALVAVMVLTPLLSLSTGSLDLLLIPLISLVILALYTPIIMAAWFSPALIVLHKVPVFEAMSMSFKGCWRNMVPFLLYGLVLMVLAVLAIFTLGLGFLVLIPVIYASIFCSYKDIFVDE
ncbi:hypothetical protein DWB84_09215 [Saccharophagus sp. K07]|uniref:BPSS1780 family membrane protein n=1 Tax=Saccharophagus sp. K07 TaxID=2283636 RepID=UPI0016523C3A|nr:BPSS1780 family membrane protein [Saccharophagus sp. K07]MBC6905633.1 hypothetical protein [Saccharophagus sp. K07]